jgi:cytochrome c oxidase cbb3-type subunit 3
MPKKTKYSISLISIFFLMNTQPIWAAGPPQPSSFSNPLAITLLCFMLVLLFIIGILANVLIGSADIKLKKTKQEMVNPGKVLTIFFLLISTSVFAQGDVTPATSHTIGGLSASAFYIMVSVIFIELLVIVVLLLNIKSLIKIESLKIIPARAEAAVLIKKPKLSWWDRFNKFKPAEQEVDLDLGHNYDGIRELDNRLPPWWLYGFYLTIIIAGVYLWRYHVSHTGLSSKEEYEHSVAKAELDIHEYLKLKGEAIDENTVTVLSGSEEIAAGKIIFLKSCAACHKETGAGDVGPNLTDEYWLHGGDIKSIFKTIRYGFNAMPTWQNSYSNKQIAEVASYIKTLKGTNPPNSKGPQGDLYKEEATVTQPAVDSMAKKDKKITMN